MCAIRSTHRAVAICSIAVLISACATWRTNAPSHDRCAPAGYDRSALEDLRAGGFHFDDLQTGERFGEDIIACLASRDPFLRDEIAYGALTALLREQRLSSATRSRIAERLLAALDAEDTDGFGRPFAVLALSEIVRSDRIEPFLGSDMRADILQRGVSYFVSITDYRGFDEREGWRHGAAHGADLFLQMVLNPNYSNDDLARVRDAIGAQVAPSGHFYIYGEPDRLMRPILYMARRNVFTEQEWAEWFERLASPGPLESWASALGTREGLERRHNVTAFVQSVWINARLSESETDDVLLPGAEAALRMLP